MSQNDDLFTENLSESDVAHWTGTDIKMWQQNPIWRVKSESVSSSCTAKNHIVTSSLANNAIIFIFPCHKIDFLVTATELLACYLLVG